MFRFCRHETVPGFDGHHYHSRSVLALVLLSEGARLRVLLCSLCFCVDNMMILTTAGIDLMGTTTITVGNDGWQPPPCNVHRS